MIYRDQFYSCCFNIYLTSCDQFLTGNSTVYCQEKPSSPSITVFMTDVIDCSKFHRFQSHMSTRCYFRKAFDSVCHTNLLIKLWDFGITGDLWHWFKSYLTDRQQCVIINNSTSTTLPVLSGVPQGSILGPILFSIYVNDLLSSIQNSRILLFADDAKLYRPINCDTDMSLLQLDIDLLYDWNINNHVHFNTSKCISLSLNKKLSTNYHMANDQLPQQVSHRDLGVLLSSDLSWSHRYDHICANAYKSLGLLCRTFPNCHSIQAKKALYITLVRSKLVYNSQLWNPHLIKDIIILERVQRRSTKYILNDFSSNYKCRLSRLNLLPLMYMFNYYDILIFIKHLKHPSSHFDISQYVTFSHGSTRSASYNKLHHKYSANNLLRNSYFCRLPRIWDSLPPMDLNKPLTMLKSLIVKTLWDHFMINFNSENPCTYHFVCPCRNCYPNFQIINFTV